MSSPADEPRVAPASDYDTFVNWDARLARELPFFLRLFAEAGVRSLIDVGAGSARHAIAFAEQGMTVDAVDPDDSMLAQAEANVAEAAERIAEAGGELRLVRGGFGELASLGLGGADALLCTGNALPHVAGLAGLREALADFHAVLRPGGVLVLHLLNHARLLGGKPRVIPPIIREVPEGTRVFLRVIDYPVGGRVPRLRLRDAHPRRRRRLGRGVAPFSAYGASARAARAQSLPTRASRASRRSGRTTAGRSMPTRTRASSSSPGKTAEGRSRGGPCGDQLAEDTRRGPRRQVRPSAASQAAMGTVGREPLRQPPEYRAASRSSSTYRWHSGRPATFW